MCVIYLFICFVVNLFGRASWFTSRMNENDSIKSNNNDHIKDLMYDRDSINSTFTPTTPTSSASIAVSNVNVIGNNTINSNIFNLNSNNVKESPTKEKLKKIYSANEIKFDDLEKHQNDYRPNTKNDKKYIYSDDNSIEDIEDRNMNINELSITESNNSDLSGTIEEIIILETLERYFSYGYTVVMTLFVTIIFTLFLNIYIIILLLNLFIVAVSRLSNPFKEITKD